jgi:thiazole/oxazole-forming peptide maturase SagD family component
MQTWWGRRRVTRIVPLPGDPWALQKRLEMVARSPLTVELYDMTTDIEIPTALAVATSEIFPHRMVAAASRDTLAGACAKAIDEIFSLRSVLAHGPIADPPEDPFQIVQLEEHATYYAAGAHDEAFAFLTAVPEAPLRDLEAGHAHVAPACWDDVVTRIDSLEPLGIEVCWADVTAPEMTDLGVVAKVVATELVPLSAAHSVRWLGMSRVQQALAASGERSVNPWPHPFA